MLGFFPALGDCHQSIQTDLYTHYVWVTNVVSMTISHHLLSMAHVIYDEPLAAPWR